VNNQAKYFIGIDGGGTKCKARLEDANGQLLAEAIAGPANAFRDLAGSTASVLAACEQAIKVANIDGLTLNQLHAGIGLAGINIPEVKVAFESQSLPFASAHVTTDLHIACLGAHQGETGAIVIIGTGSSGVVITPEQQIEYGGHGFVVGDKASGAWLGKKAISHCLETLDGLIEQNELSVRVLEKLNCQNAQQVVNLTLDAKPSFYASLAPTVFELASQQQPDALALVHDASHYITKLSNKLLSSKPSRLSFIGGVTQVLIPYLPAALQTMIQPALASPEQGAIIFAKSQAKSDFK
jgi:glucosamine kinase